MATLGSMIKRPVPAGSAAASALIGLMTGVILTMSVTAGVLSGPATLHRQSPVGVATVKGELVSHDRSEQGLGLDTVGGEQVAHNRSEEGLGGQ